MSSSFKKDSSLISSTNMLKHSTTPGVSQINNNSANINDVTKAQEDVQLVQDSTIGQFTYLKPSLEGYFKFKIDSEIQSFNSLKNKYHIIFCITIQRDSIDFSTNLQLSIKAIFNNLKSLKDFNINENKVLICFNLQRLTKENNLYSLFLLNGNDSTEDEKKSLKETFTNLEYDEYLGIKTQCAEDKTFSTCIDCFLFTKNTIFTQIEIFKLFSKAICYKTIDLNITNNYPTYTCFIQAGVMPTESSIKNLIISLYEIPKHGGVSTNICSVPSLETVPTGIFSKIQQYEYVHYNVYDLHYYNMTCTVPINSHFCVFKLTKGLLDQLLVFYTSKINIDASVYYHDNLLGIYLSQFGYKINYVPSIESHKVQKDITITDVMYNYSRKLQGHLLLNYDLLTSELTSCVHCNALKKFFLFFHLIGSLFEFTFPCFCMMVIYAIYYEGFGLTDNKPNACIFMTGLYAILTIIYIGISLANPNPNGSYKLFLAIYFINEIYTLLTLIVSIPGMHFVRINRHNTLYKFNIAAIVCFLIFNFIFGIIPLLLNVKKIIENIVNMLLYLVMGTANYTSLFLVHGICNMADSYGREELITTKNYLLELVKASEYQDHRNKKGIIVICYITANSLLAFFILLLTTRKKRMHCVIALSIIFTIYNGFKMFAILWSKIVVTKEIENSITDNKTITAVKSTFNIMGISDDMETPNKDEYGNDNKYEMNQHYSNNNNENEYTNHNAENEDVNRNDNEEDEYNDKEDNAENGG